jgi:hypothetical protein
VDRRVFINYRGEDSHSYGALLYTELARQFGEDQVFLDCESIPAGADFVEELLDRVRLARVMLAVIGPRWLAATNLAGRRRIDDPDDWIRRELAEAFAAGVRVIPVLTEQVKMPAATDLPADIAALSRCQYRRLRHHDPTVDLARIVTDLTGMDPTLPVSDRLLRWAPGLRERWRIGRDGEPDPLTVTLRVDAAEYVRIPGDGGSEILPRSGHSVYITVETSSTQAVILHQIVPVVLSHDPLREARPMLHAGVVPVRRFHAC